MDDLRDRPLVSSSKHAQAKSLGSLDSWFQAVAAAFTSFSFEGVVSADLDKGSDNIVVWRRKTWVNLRLEPRVVQTQKS
jgi:hypothetical protein